MSWDTGSKRKSATGKCVPFIWKFPAWLVINDHQSDSPSERDHVGPPTCFYGLIEAAPHSKAG